MELLLHIWLYYGVFSVLLMLFFILIFGLHERFRGSSFYKIVQCDMCLNLACYFNSWIFRLAQRPDTGFLLETLYYNHHWIFRFIAFSNHFFFQTQSISIIILCFYRFSLIKFENSNKFWSKWYIFVYLAIILYSVAINLPVAYIFHPLIYNETLKYFVDSKTPLDEQFVFSCHLVVCTLVYFLTIVTLGTLTLKNLRIRFSNLNSRQQKEDQRTQEMMKRMTIIVAINTVVYLMLIVWEFTVGLLFPNMSNDMQTNMMMCVSDMLSFSMPYTLLFCDKNVCEVIFGNFKFQLRSGVTSIIAPGSIT
ncbi:unnamed protein product [Caenorhabditis angaria]|uniref:Serpentine receptor class gamma n=1 Tax=Caenorhabditis angaria TaxID=860376 RepID=A0A9P1ISY7_9PELO|nr:unnamed protein product [Caenorhabditis angaria]